MWCPASGFDASALERRIRADLADCVREYTRTQDAIKTQTQLQNTSLMWPGIWNFVDDSQLKLGFINFVGSVLYDCKFPTQGAVAIPEQTMLYYVYDRQRVFLKSHKAPPTHQQIRATSVGQRLASSKRHDYGIPSDHDWKADWAQTNKAMSSAARAMRGHNRTDAKSAKSKKAVTTPPNSMVTKDNHGPPDSNEGPGLHGHQAPSAMVDAAVVLTRGDVAADTAPRSTVDAVTAGQDLSNPNVATVVQDNAASVPDSLSATPRSPLTFGEVAILRTPRNKGNGLVTKAWGPPPTAPSKLTRPGDSVAQRDAGDSVPSFASIIAEQASDGKQPLLGGHDSFGSESHVAQTSSAPAEDNRQPQAVKETIREDAATEAASICNTRQAVDGRVALEPHNAATISCSSRDASPVVDKEEILLARVRAESITPFLSSLQKVELRGLLDRLRNTMDGAGPSHSRVDNNAVALQALQQWLSSAAIAHTSPVHASTHATPFGTAQIVGPPMATVHPLPELTVSPLHRHTGRERQTQGNCSRRSPAPEQTGRGSQIPGQAGPASSPSRHKIAHTEFAHSDFSAPEPVPAQERIRAIRACYKEGDFVMVPHSLAPYFATCRKPATPDCCTYVATFHHTFDGTCLAQPCAQFSDEHGRLHHWCTWHVPYTLVWQDDDMPHQILGAKIRADEFFETTSVCTAHIGNDTKYRDVPRGSSTPSPLRSGSKHGFRVAKATLRRRAARARRREDDRLLAALSTSSARKGQHGGDVQDDHSSGGSSDTSSTSSTSSDSSSFPASADMSSSARRSDSTWMAKKRRSLPYKRKAARERFDALVRSRRRFFGPEEFNVGSLPTRPQPFSFLELMTELEDFRESVSCQERWLVAWFPELLDGYALEMKHDILLALSSSSSVTRDSRSRSKDHQSNAMRSRLRLSDVEQAMRKVFYSAEQRDLAESKLSALALPTDLLAGDLVRSFHDTERQARNLCFVLDFPESTLSAVTRRLVKGIKAFEVLWSHLLRERNYNTLVATIKSHLESYAANRRYDAAAHVEFVKDVAPGIDNVHAVGDNAPSKSSTDALYDYNKHKRPARVISCWGCGSTGHKLPQCKSPDAEKNGAEKLRLFRERMSQRRKKGNRVTFADYERLADALHQCTSIGIAARASPDGCRTPPAVVEPGSTTSDADDDTADDQVDDSIQFFYDEADDSAAVHRLDTFAYEHEFLPPHPEKQTNFCFKPHCWWL